MTAKTMQTHSHMLNFANVQKERKSELHCKKVTPDIGYLSCIYLSYKYVNWPIFIFSIENIISVIKTFLIFWFKLCYVDKGKLKKEIKDEFAIIAK